MKASQLSSFKNFNLATVVFILFMYLFILWDKAKGFYTTPHLHIGAHLAKRQ